MTFSSGLNTLFKYRHFNRDIIIQRVDWYVSYKLGYRDLVKMTAERRIERAHNALLHGVRQIMAELEQRRMRFVGTGATTSGPLGVTQPAFRTRSFGNGNRCLSGKHQQ